MNSFFKKITSFSLLIVFFLVPIIPVFAQNTPRAIPVNENTLEPITINTNNQAGTALTGSGGSGSGFSGNAGAAASGISGCVLSGALANVVKNYITDAVSSVVSMAVPVSENVIRGKETGTVVGISWDQIAYCAVNEIIAQIGRATVAWINSGFQGNPVFVDDPEQFFADIADIQAGNFLNEISNGFLCSPIQSLVRVNLATRYNNSISTSNNSCTFSGIAGNIEQFVSGETFSWDDWYSYTQVSSNNAFGATIYGNIELDSRIAQSLGVQSQLLDWGRGFLSFKDPETGKVNSPGSLVQEQLNQRLFNGESRINVADEFDEIVTALVNQLVKVAINEVTQSGSSSSRSYGSSVYEEVDTSDLADISYDDSGTNANGSDARTEEVRTGVVSDGIEIITKFPTQGNTAVAGQWFRGYYVGDTVTVQWIPGTKNEDRSLFETYEIRLKNIRFGGRGAGGEILIAKIPATNTKYSFVLSDSIIQELLDKKQFNTTFEESNNMYAIEIEGVSDSGSFPRDYSSPNAVDISSTFTVKYK